MIKTSFLFSIVKIDNVFSFGVGHFGSNILRPTSILSIGSKHKLVIKVEKWVGV